MELKNQKSDHVVIVTSDAADARVKKFRFKAWMVWTAVIAMCVAVGVLLGYIAYEERLWNAANQKMNQTVEEYKTIQDALAAENEALRMEVENLSNKVVVLSDTITQLKAVEEELSVKVNKIITPTLLPITGSATIGEILEPEPMSIFTAAEGAVVVATAGGIVVEISEDSEYGHKIVIDHGNGYKTIYRYQSNPLAATGDTVSQGGVLFLIDEKDTKLGYQIQKDDVFIVPAEMMEIKG